MHACGRADKINYFTLHLNIEKFYALCIQAFITNYNLRIIYSFDGTHHHYPFIVNYGNCTLFSYLTRINHSQIALTAKHFFRVSLIVIKRNIFSVRDGLAIFTMGTLKYIWNEIRNIVDVGVSKLSDC